MLQSGTRRSVDNWDGIAAVVWKLQTLWHLLFFLSPWSSGLARARSAGSIPVEMGKWAPWDLTCY